MVSMFLILISRSWFMVLIDGLDPLDLESSFWLMVLMFMLFTFDVENSQFILFSLIQWFG
jgi:hypothetical protein